MNDHTQPTLAETTNPPAAATADLTGTTLGDFHIIRRLGQGGMGQVYLAEQTSLQRKVALKFLRPDLAADPKALERFDREAKSVASFTHPNIVQVYAIGAAGALHYMVLEYVEGRNLREYINRKGPMDLPASLSIMRQVATALQKASETGLVHRDIKPENILLTRKGEVKVADFGLSRIFGGEQEVHLTQSGMTLGTPLYMSPEQVQAKPLDPRSDIYSFGVTCYHMLAGQPPFKGSTPFEVALQHVQGTPPPLQELRPDLPPELGVLVHRMMNKDPDQRPQTGREVLRGLSQLRNPADAGAVAGSTIAVPTSSGRLQGVGAMAASPTEALPPARSFLRPRAAIWVAVSLALAGASGVGLRMWANARTPVPVVAKDDHPNLPLASEHEQHLLSAVRMYATPRFDRPDAIRVGASHHVELGVVYLEQKRYDEAEKLFEEMVKRPAAPPMYQKIGNLGLGITYAMRDEYDRSNKQFQDQRDPMAKAVGTKGIMPPQLFLPPEELINLKYWMLTALDRNATHGPLPLPLQRLREQLKTPWTPPIGKSKGKGG